MAELHVQKKRSQLWWLWVLLLLIVLGVVYYLLVQNNTLPDTFGLKNATASVANICKNIIV